MPPPPLGRVRSLEHLLPILIDHYDWPIDDRHPLEDLTFEYTAAELGVAANEFAGVKVQQLRELAPGQPWGIFLLKFAERKLSITALRKVLRQFVLRKRQDNPDRKTWQLEHLLFICEHQTAEGKSITFVHFEQPGIPGRVAKISSFGWTEQSHNRTALEHNLPYLRWPENSADAAAWLSAWQRAFDVEAVTKKFFDEYDRVFAEVEAKVKGIRGEEARRLYTQRLFNRLLFLYFIQKKGWLEFEGDKNYLRALLNAAERNQENFLHYRLYWAFFYGLNTAMEDHATHSAPELYERRGKVPFLNGGLFDLEDEYDAHEAVTLPNSAFESILKLFERYNFTVSESTPLDIEVAVDPEMLGKVFEKLVIGRHETGSYYTPRSIVSFMCRESLKRYLANALAQQAAVGKKQGGIPLSPLERAGPMVKKVSSLLDASSQTPPPPAISDGVDEAIAKFVDLGDPSGLSNPDAVLTALKNVTVCDPACGSGAFLLGMMQELLRLRDALFVAHAKDHRAIYDRKLEIIQKNLYGVDQDPFAVGIAKLRLWLSLAVDFHGDTPPTLPNLDYRIERGDSLLGPNPAFTNDLGGLALKDTLKELKADKAQFGKEHGETKRALKKRIAELEHDLHELLESPDEMFDWRVAFVEVFEAGGFDIVVGNPPYVRQEQIKEMKPALKNSYLCYTGVADLFVYFYERGIRILKKGGQFAFITSNKWYRSGYGEKLRTWLAAETRLHALIDFGDAPVFEAIAYPTIVLLERSKPAADATFRGYTWVPGPNVEEFVDIFRREAFDIPQTSLHKGGWRLEGSAKRNLLDKLRAGGKPLGEYCKGRFYRGILTGYNDAFVVDRATRDRLIAEHKSSEKVLKPFLRGRDVKRWRVEPQDKWLIFTRRGIDIKAYPAIHEHLKQFKKGLMPGGEGGRKPGSYEWYEIQDNIAYWEEFAQPKIIYPDIAPFCTFAFDESGLFPDCTLFLVPEATRYLLAVLNSACIDWFVTKICPAIRGDFRRFKSIYMTQISIPAAPKAEQAALEKLVRRIVAAKEQSPGADVAALEAEVNDRVYRLFHLTPEEIKVIEGV